MAPPAVLAVSSLPGKFVRRLGVGLIILGLVGGFAIAAWEIATWLPLANAWQRRFTVHRILFAVVTFIDVPILQILLVGIGLCLATRAESRTVRGTHNAIVRSQGIH